MFSSKQKEIDRLNARCVELAQQLRDSNLDNKQLRELRLEAVRENTKIHKSYAKQTDLINDIVKELYNNVKTDTQKVEKIREVIRLQTK